MTFKHFILTRFNLDLYGENPHKIKDPKEWMAHRLELFNQYCLPSVLKQTSQEFTWLLAFDSKTPLEIIIEYDYIPNIIICYEHPTEWLRSQPIAADWLITSRFDNDDMYLPTFVEDIQNAAKFKSEIIDIDYRAMDVKTGKLYTSNRFKANSPFLSLCEPWGSNITTALGRPHSTMPDYFEARKLGGYHAIQLIHDKNICNRINGIPV